MSFQEKLLYVRAKLNLSQTELAKELDVSFSTINRWETGKVVPTKKLFWLSNYIIKKKIFVLIKRRMNKISWNPFNTNESATLKSSKVSFYKGIFWYL